MTNAGQFWERTRLGEIGYGGKERCIDSMDPCYLRLTEVETLQGVPNKAEGKLGWTPTNQFTEMVREVLKAAERDALIKYQAFKTMDCHE